LRFLNWNILAGGGTRLDRIARCIEKNLPQVCVLTEYRSGKSGNLLKSKLLEMGFDKSTEAPALPGQNSVLIIGNTGCYGLQEVEIDLQIPVGLSPFIAAMMAMGTVIIGVFCPTESIGRQFIDYLCGLSKRYPDSSIMAVGDFFYGPRASNLSFGKPLNKLNSLGWESSWDISPYYAEHWSHQARGRSRPDHIYLFGEIKKRFDCMELDEAALRERISDHAPVLADFHSHPCWLPLEEYPRKRISLSPSESKGA